MFLRLRFLPFLLIFSLLLAGCSDTASQEDAGALSAEKSQEDDLSETLILEINGKTFQATLADTEAARSLVMHLKEEPLSLALRDYGGFEKVGDLGRALPTDDVQITAESGDIVLYQGDQLVLFYDSNRWAYTQIAHVNDLDGWEETLGSGDVNVTLSSR